MRESDQSYYLREERMGWILGPYEAGAPARFADGVPSWFGKSLFDGDLERLIPHVEGAQRRVPGARELRHQGHRQRADLVHAGRQRADRAGLGPAERLAQRGPQLRHHRGGRRRLAARGMDRRGRAGHRHARASTRAASAPTPASATWCTKNEETYRNVFTIHYPDEERPDARPGEDEPGLREAEAHGRRVRPALRLGARQLVRAGGRRARRTTGASAAPTTSSTSATNAGGCASSVGVIDLTPFTKHEVAGRAPRPGSIRWSRTRCRRRSGAWRCATRSRSAAASAPSSRSRSSASEHFYLVSAGAAERYDSDYLREAPAGRRLGARCRTSRPPAAASSLAGPRSREVLAKLTDTPLDNDAFPWLTGQAARSRARDRTCTCCA